MNSSNIQDLRKKQQKNGIWNNNLAGETSKHQNMSYVFKLAPESPCNNRSYEIYNHDESTYDSVHNYETDLCKDSTDDDFSDTDSSKTEGYAVLDVEYELASTSADDDEDDSSISSGTEEIATTAYFGFNALMGRHNEISDVDSDDFILADTEDDTDGSIDLELGQADYWKCVKCNNKQNNPLYRYCEKCYQVRKSLFPPRPRRHKKTKTIDNARKRKMAQQPHDYSTSEIDSGSEFESPAKKKLVREEHHCSRPTTPSSCIKNGNQFMKSEKREGGKHANSAGELSCNNTSSDDGDDGETSTASSLPKCNANKESRPGDIVKKIKVSPSASIEIAKVASCYPSTSFIKCESSRNDINCLEFKLENKFIQNVFRQDYKRPQCLDLQKDSGMSSCQESSQEFSSSPVEEGNYLVRSASSISSQSVESHNSDFPLSQASTTLQRDTEDESDSEQFFTRVDEFVKSNSAEKDSMGMCSFCLVNPRNGLFSHSNSAHWVCCYKCAVRVWKKRKSCPICNCKVKKILKLFA